MQPVRNPSGAGKTLDGSLKDYLGLMQTGLLERERNHAGAYALFRWATKAVDSAHGSF